MQLYIQDPTDPESPLLHEKMLEVCEGATHGAGAFAFATRSGVELLVNDEIFKRLTARGSFNLIVGVDEVTNVRALTALQEMCSELPGLVVKVFYHELSQRTFHPKFCWFRHRRKGFLISGSGNLTARGLRGNWEAFAIGELALDAADALEAQWARWVELHAENLKSLDNENVLARAAQNVWRRRPRRPAPIPEEEEDEEPEAGPDRLHRVLIAEIPGATNRRWNQANFDIHNFRHFFGAEPGAVQRILLQHVDASGSLGVLENRPSVTVRSRNFRFELAAAARLEYPREGRPIAVFIEIARRTFRYRLLMPGDPHYRIMEAYLDRTWTGRADRMRRIPMTATELRRVWPDSPLWIRPLDVEE